MELVLPAGHCFIRKTIYISINNISLISNKKGKKKKEERNSHGLT